jgi:hypothetical protein
LSKFNRKSKTKSQASGGKKYFYRSRAVPAADLAPDPEETKGEKKKYVADDVKDGKSTRPMNIRESPESFPLGLDEGRKGG